MRLNIIITLSVLVSASAIGAFANAQPKPTAVSQVDACVKCDELKRLEKQLLNTKPDDTAAVNSLQAKASELVQAMKDKKDVLAPQQVKALVPIMSSLLQKDPAKAIVVSNLNVINKNQSLFDIEISKLSKVDKEAFARAIENAKREEEAGNDRPEAP